MIKHIITGLIGGLAYSLSGLANKKKREKFNLKKMLPTLITAGIIGAIAGYLGQDYGVVANSSMVAGITAVIEKLCKAIYRRLK